MAAPLVSVTTPMIDPYTFWPHPAEGVSARATTTVKISASFLRFGISFLPKKLSNCPGQLPHGCTGRRRWILIWEHSRRYGQPPKSHNDTPVGPLFRPTRRNSQAQFRYSLLNESGNSIVGGVPC